MAITPAMGPISFKCCSKASDLRHPRPRHPVDTARSSRRGDRLKEPICCDCLQPLVCRVSDAGDAGEAKWTVPGVRKPPKNEPAGDGARRGGAPGYRDFANAESAFDGAQCVWSQAMT